MFLEIITLLSVFQLVYTGSPANGCNCADSADLAAGVYDETALKNIQQRMDLLNENLRLKIDLLDVTLNKQLMLLRNEFKNDLEKFKEASVTSKEPSKPVDSDQKSSQKDCVDSSAKLIDLRGDQSSSHFKNSTVTIPSLPTNCADASKERGQTGIYQIKIALHEPFHVNCIRDKTTAWLVIQRRQDGSIDFYRRWCEYQHGFGNLENEFFIGLDKIHALTQSTMHELWIEMEDFEGVKRWAKYRNFVIGGASEGYALKSIGNYAGDAGDALTGHLGMKWTTLDVDHDKNPENCAQLFSGAWWYNNCHSSNLNGQYLHGAYEKDQYARGIGWYPWHGHNYSLKYVHMAIRPV